MSTEVEVPPALVTVELLTIVRTLSRVVNGIPLILTEYVLAETTCAHKVKSSPPTLSECAYLTRFIANLLHPGLYLSVLDRATCSIIKPENSDGLLCHHGSVGVLHKLPDRFFAFLMHWPVFD